MTARDANKVRLIATAAGIDNAARVPNSKDHEYFRRQHGCLVQRRPDGGEIILLCYFFGSAGLSRRSILASARSLVTKSTCALRDANCSISPRTLSNGGGSRVRLSSTLSTCQPNWVLIGPDSCPFSSLNATSENSGTIWSRVK